MKEDDGARECSPVWAAASIGECPRVSRVVTDGLFRASFREVNKTRGLLIADCGVSFRDGQLPFKL
ncbi:hypothetical protein DFR24_4236 [Panacagrimonas perspica]|uniref:Uncharacterized protein n=1 Tax=Panacagrimonas perspica TaxID=381431 RepID=A0A4R7NYI4_9GAMM|nr:hypothetical protein [Panacagrimonas perspica]TDU25791.1 hypothetical protein DFR24_4236 [Panacagrimonas perspica]